MDLPSWAGKYIGLPFAAHGDDPTGVSCYGLVCLVMREEFQVALPTYDEGYVTATDRQEIASLFTTGIPRDWEPVIQPRPGDAVVFQLRGQPLHCGLWLTPEHFLHVERGTSTCIGRFTHPKWRGRLLGTFRHRALCPNP